VGEEEAKGPSKEHVVPSIGRRLSGVLCEPVATFRALDPAWGLLAPWLVIAGAGLVFGAVHFAQVDTKHLTEQMMAHQQSFLSDQTRRAMAQAEQSMNLGKWGALMTNLGLVAGPTVLSVLAIVTVGLFLFAGSKVLGGRNDLLRAIVVAAHAKLVAVAGYGVTTVALVLGNPAPDTSLKNVVDEVANPIGAALLGFLDPIAIWHTVLLGIGLSLSLGVKRNRAAAYVIALHVIIRLPGVAAAALSLLQRG